MARHVVDLSGGSIDGAEHDVFVEAGHHRGRQLEAIGVEGIEPVARRGVLPFSDLFESLDADEAERRRELVHAQVQTRLVVARLAVVAKRASECHQVGVARDEHAPLARRNRLGRGERPNPGIAPRARPATLEGRAVGVGAVFDQEDALRAAEVGDAVDFEGDVAADVDEEGSARSMLRGFCLEVCERGAEIGAVAVHEHDLGAGGARRQRCRHERVRWAEHGPTADAGEFERCQSCARPTARGHGRKSIPGLPRRLECFDERSLRPAL